MRLTRITSFLIIMILISCNNELEFERLEPNCSIRGESIREAYLVHNWSDNAKNEKTIDDYACQIASNYVSTNVHLNLSFYKYSRKTNNEYLKNNYNGQTYSLVNDYLWHYNYHPNSKEKQRLSKTKVKNVKGRKFFFPELECKF